MSRNPFKYGKAVVGDDFIDREDELKELTSDLLSGQSVIIYSHRRLGKSSLILESFRRMEREDVITIYIDMYGVSSLNALIEMMIRNSVSQSYNKIEKVGKVAGEFLKGLRPKFYLEEGQIGVEVYREETNQKTLEEALNFPQKVAEKKDQRVIMAFDEFQEITNLDGVDIEKTMRSVFQMHDRVSYLFVGSETHLLQDMFEDGDRPFYNFGKIKTLGKIPRDEFAEAVKEKFEDTGRSIRHSIIEKVLDFTEGHPYYTQQLCHELWYLSDEEALEEETVERAKENILQYRSDFYEHRWSELSSKIQRRLLLAVADGVEDIYSEETIREYQLKTSSHVQKANKALKSKGIIKDRSIVDLFFKSWIESKFL